MTARFSDTVLNAWLDGELPADQRAEVESWLRDHPEDAARVRLWAADGEAVRASLDSVLTDAVPPRLVQMVLDGQPASPWAGWQRWAAALAVFLIGGATGAALTWRLLPQTAATSAATAPAGWAQRAVVAHSVYVPEGRHAVEVKAQEEHLSRWLTKRLDVPVKLFDLRAQGYELVGGRLLPDAAGPSAQLMYQAIAVPGAAVGATAARVGSPGRPATAAPEAKPSRVTVYLRKPESNTPAAFRFEQRGELGMFYWVEGQSAHGGPTGYALVGALPREQLLALAEAIYRQGAVAAP